MRIEVIDASVDFSGRQVFADLTCTFTSGRVNALVGPSGSGKSTLLAVVAGIQRLTSGRVELHPDSGPPVAPDARLVAWVPQGSNALARRTVLDNVLIAALARGQPMAMAESTASEALELVGLAARRHDQARVLSGGEVQRVALARALASGKELILADEPTANLDIVNTHLVADLLHHLPTNVTVVVATHDETLVAAASHVVHLRPGGTP